MENRVRMGGLIKECKQRGEWAEMYFMMLALEHDLRVSKPYGDSGRYDVGVEGREKINRVQVKSTIYRRRGNGYSLNVMGPQRKKYVPGTVDFFAILLIPIDDWYIIPYEVIGTKNLSLHFTPGSKRQKYGEYQEGWELLRGTGRVGLDGKADTSLRSERRNLCGVTQQLLSENPGRAGRPSPHVTV
jgi:hypothetical protein